MKIEKEYKNKIFKKQRKISKFQYTVNELLDYLKVPVKEFPRYAKYVKELGTENIPRIISEIKIIQNWVSREKNGKLNKVAYFLKNYRIKFTKRIKKKK